MAHPICLQRFRNRTDRNPVEVLYSNLDYGETGAQQHSFADRSEVLATETDSVAPQAHIVAEDEAHFQRDANAVAGHTSAHSDHT